MCDDQQEEEVFDPFDKYVLYEKDGVVFGQSEACERPPIDVIAVIERERAQPHWQPPRRYQVWRHQHFYHHEHAFTDDLWEEIALQAAWRDQLAKILRTQQPSLQFIVETSWLDRTTWYQPFDDAPTEDDEVWEPARVSISNFVIDWESLVAEHGESGAAQFLAKHKRQQEDPQLCIDCGITDLTDVHEPDALRGVRQGRCTGCGKLYIFETRTIRDRVGPAASESQDTSDSSRRST